MTGRAQELRDIANQLAELSAQLRSILTQMDAEHRSRASEVRYGRITHTPADDVEPWHGKVTRSPYPANSGAHDYSEGPPVEFGDIDSNGHRLPMNFRYKGEDFHR